MAIDFDVLNSLDRIPVFLRILQMICSIIVIACILANNDGILLVFSVSVCSFNDSTSTCNYGLAIGFISLIFGIYFFVVYGLSDRMNFYVRRILSLVEILINAILSIMWLAAFIDLTVKWAQTPSFNFPIKWLASNNRAAISFAFFAFVFQTILALLSITTMLSSLLMGHDGNIDKSPIVPQEEGQSFEKQLTLSHCYRKFRPADKNDPIGQVYVRNDGTEANYQTLDSY